jgi:hypothetical protein
VTIEKHTLEVRGNVIALACPTNDVLDFGGHFLSLGWDSFFKTGGFSTPTPVYVNNPRWQA